MDLSATAIGSADVIVTNADPIVVGPYTARPEGTLASGELEGSMFNVFLTG